MSNSTEQKGFLFFATAQAMRNVRRINVHASINEKFFIGNIASITDNLHFFITEENKVTPAEMFNIPVSGFAGENLTFASGEEQVTIPQAYESNKLPVYLLTELLKLVRPNSYTQESPDFDAGHTIISSMDEDTQIAMGDGADARLPKLADFIMAFLVAVLRPQQGYSVSTKDTGWYTVLRDTDRFPAVKKILLEVSASYYISYYPNTRVVVSFDRDFVFNKDKTGKSVKAFDTYLSDYITLPVTATKETEERLFTEEEIMGVAEEDSRTAEALGGWKAAEWLAGSKETMVKFIQGVTIAMDNDFVTDPVQVSTRVLNALGDMEDWYYGKPLFEYGHNRYVRSNWSKRCDGKTKKELHNLKCELGKRLASVAGTVTYLFDAYNEAVANGFVGAPKDFDIDINPEVSPAKETVSPVTTSKENVKPAAEYYMLNIDWESEPLPAWFSDSPESAIEQVAGKITALSEKEISTENPEAFVEEALMIMISIQSWGEQRWCVSHPLVIEMMAKLEQCTRRGVYSSGRLEDLKFRIIGRLNTMLNNLANYMVIYHKAKSFMDVSGMTPTEVVEKFRNSPEYGDLLNTERPVVAPAVTSLTKAHDAMEEFKEKIHVKSEMKKVSEKDTRLETIRGWANIPQQIREMAIMDKMDSQTQTLLQSVVESMATDLTSLLKLLRSRR